MHSATAIGEATVRRLLVPVAGIAWLLLNTVPATAQGLGLDMTIGFSMGQTSGNYRDNARGFSGDALAAYRISAAGGVYSAGASYTTQGTGVTTDDCIVQADGTCLPHFPDFSIIALLGARDIAPGLRIATGPGAARASGDWSTTRLAWAARLDAAAPAHSVFALLVSLRAFVVPSYESAPFMLGSFGIGLRIGGVPPR